MKTIKQWLESIEDTDVRKRALRNMLAFKEREYADSKQQALTSAFDWQETPEGFNYWRSEALGLPPQIKLIPEAIQFAEWIRLNYRLSSSMINVGDWYRDGTTNLTTTELYELFKKENNG